MKLHVLQRINQETYIPQENVATWACMNMRLKYSMRYENDWIDMKQCTNEPCLFRQEHEVGVQKMWRCVSILCDVTTTLLQTLNAWCIIINV